MTYPVSHDTRGEYLEFGTGWIDPDPRLLTPSTNLPLPQTPVITPDSEKYLDPEPYSWRRRDPLPPKLVESTIFPALTNTPIKLISLTTTPIPDSEKFLVPDPNF